MNVSLDQFRRSREGGNPADQVAQASRLWFVDFGLRTNTGQRPVPLLRGNDNDSKPAFTLIETVASLAILSVLILAIGSTIVLATHALPDPDDPTVNTIRAADVLDQITADLETATAIVERTGRGVTVVVPDRDDDGDPELIQYDWSGDRGDPLRRSTNGSPPAVLLPNLEQFKVEYRYTTTQQTYAGLAQETGSKRLLGSFTPSGYYNSDGNKAGQYVKPDLPADAVAYRVTDFDVLVYRGLLSLGLPSSELRLANLDGRPGNVLLATATSVQISLLNGTGWLNFQFEPPPVPAVRGVTVTIASNLSKYWKSGASGRLNHSNGTWNDDDSSSLIYRLFGYPLIPGQDKTVTRQYVDRVHLTLDVAGDSAAVRSATTMLARPELAYAHWRTDFERDPTSLDRDLNGTSDFVRSDAQSFDSSSLSDGLWHVNTNAWLVTSPAGPFTRPTVLEARVRDRQDDGNGAGIWINANDRNGRGAPIWTDLRLVGDGTQILRLYNQQIDGNHDPILLQEVRGLPEGFLNVRMIINPNDYSVNLRVAGIDHGTFSYQGYYQPNQPRFAAAYSAGAGGEFDWFEVTVPKEDQ